MKVIFLKRTTLLLLVACFVFMSTYVLNGTILSVSATNFNNNRLLPIYSVQTDENKVAISFDAAWGADKTTEIMNICDEYGVKATFFLVGFWIEKYPDKVKEIYNRGFEIGIHSNTHPDMTKLTTNQIEQELKINKNQIYELTNSMPKLFRPPYGYYNNNLINVCNKQKLSCIEWSVDTLDWKGLTASEICGRVMQKSQNGSIILCHNNSDNILPALKLIFEYFKTKQTKVVPIGELIYYENFKINSQGTQINLKEN